MGIPDTKARINLTIDKELKKKAEQLAKIEERSFNSFVVIAVKERIERIEKSNSTGPD